MRNSTRYCSISLQRKSSGRSQHGSTEGVVGRARVRDGQGKGVTVVDALTAEGAFLKGDMGTTWLRLRAWA